MPAAAAFLTVRPGPRAVIGMLTAAAGSLPGGRPAARLLARDEAAAEALADGIVALIAARRGPWRLDLAGLPLGDPTLRALAARLPMATLANERSGGWSTSSPRPAHHRSRRGRPAAPACSRGRSGLLRAATRLHAAIGAVEVAVVPAGGGLVTLLDGTDRWPWWGTAPSDCAPRWERRWCG